jgi:hypothetical protein
MRKDLSYIVKGLLFAGVMYFLFKIVIPYITEGFDNPNTKVDQPCPPNSVKCPSGDCKLKSDIYGMCGYKA